jgi:hypothetical protein
MNPCRCRPFVLAFVALIALAPSALAQLRLDLGTIAVPRDFDDRTSVLPRGEYGLVLRGEELSLVQKNWRNGLERVFGIATRAEDEAAEAQKPVVEITETTADGRPVVRIRVLNARRSYTAVLRVSSEEGPRPSFAGTLDPAIARELTLLREAHNVLRAYAPRIWPGWTAYDGLEFFVTFPNRAVLILSGRTRVPQAFEALPVPAIGSKRAYIDNSRALPGAIAGITGMGGRADYEGVSATLLGPVAGVGGAAVGATARPDGPVVAAGGGDLNRLLTYVHEAFHGLQLDFTVEAEKAGRRKNRGRPVPISEPTVDSEVYAELEGEALLRAHRAPDRTAALEHLKDALVARELRHKAMPEGAVVYDVVRTRAEGTATYANIRAALLVQEQGPPRADGSADASVLEAAYKGLPAYIQAQTADRLARVKGSSNTSDERLYVYGAYQAMVLDRVFPDWKTGLFEDDRTLDEVLAERLALTPADRDAAMNRFTRLYGAEEVRARHGAAIRAREDAIAAVQGRQGRTYRIDVRQAQRNVDIRPRPGAIFVLSEQIYPHGLEGFTYGSLRLTSKDTPMRLRGQLLEWVDPEPAPGDKGYDLKCEAQESDLFRTVTVTTKGFSFTAKAVRVTDDGKVVTFAIVD